ncbi:MAG TPA: hypothetical protein DCX07_07130 [Phycisphaerales bacterium]|nr:hypothetical protein [Phycisphaerales bacterium]
MTLRQAELRAAARAKELLPDAPAVARFVAGQLSDAGGFAGRDGQADLYFTHFALACLGALGTAPPSAVAAWLETFGNGDDLDFVHRCALVRCRAHLDLPASVAQRRAMLDALNRHRSADGGFDLAVRAPRGSAYACYLALGAHQDLGADLHDPRGLARCLAALRTPDGGYANWPDSPAGSVPATAAALLVLHAISEPADRAARNWLAAQASEDGGFRAAPVAPTADLLSTAVALHALAETGGVPSACREPALAFALGLRQPSGSFRGHPLDDRSDCEYTFYALLALGQLAGATGDEP